jgi:Zn-dependent M28 family amino/carboxypeptidase
MLIRNSSKAQAVKQTAAVSDLLASVSEKDLRDWVEQFSVPRHFVAQPKVNRQIAKTIAGHLAGWGYEVSFQGKYYNVVAKPKNLGRKFQIVAAHFDSTAFTPGADDNASAIAAMLGCAKLFATINPAIPVVLVSFNCEEDGLLGSFDFVSKLSDKERNQIDCVHVLEMVGFSSDEPDSQISPVNLPIKTPTVGNFLGLLANGNSSKQMNHALRQAKAYLPDLPTVGLHVLLGFEKYLPVLHRSDHAPFWQAGIPSLMWTDTSEFRNPHYHRSSDTPDTLNYAFLRRTTQLLVATLIAAK